MSILLPPGVEIPPTWRDDPWWCDRHRQKVFDGRHDGLRARVLLAREFLRKLGFDSTDIHADAGQMNSIIDVVYPACCYVGDGVVDLICQQTRTA